MAATCGWTFGGAAVTFTRIRQVAQELVGLKPDIVFTSRTPARVAVKRETPTIPIVFVNVGDPVASGIGRRLVCCRLSQGDAGRRIEARKPPDSSIL
jgi:hypothetical protein